MNSAVLECQNRLLQLVSQKGYLIFDDIMDVANLFNLSVSEVDQLTEALQLRGILFYEDEPLEKKQLEELEYEDYSRVDYKAIYNEVIEKDSSLESLISKIRKLPTPQYGEIIALTKQNAEGNLFARERIITIHLRLVIKIALSMSQEYDFNLSECISSGFIGLINAVDKYNPSGFTAFQSYASLLITQYIQRYCIPSWVKVYYPAYYRDKLFSFVRDIKNYYADYIPKYLVQDDVIAIEQKFSFTSKEIYEFHHAYYLQAFENIELNIQLESDLDGNFNLMENNSMDMIFEIVSESMLREIILKFVNNLKEKERYVLLMRYGFDGSDGYTLEEIGNFLGVTRERIRQIESNALKKVNCSSYLKKIKEFWGEDN